MSVPPVCLLHAFPLSSAMWAAQREALGSRFRLLTPDQRGFGGSALGAEPPSLDVVADDVAALLGAQGLDQVVLGGLSMGGYVAMAFLRRHAERVAALVLADTRATADPEAARANRERIARTVLAERSPRVLLDEVLPTLLGETTKLARPAVRAAVSSMISSAAPEAVAWAQRAMAARPDSVPTLRAVTVPALVMVGAEDALTSPADAQVMADAVTSGSLVTLAGAGHLSAVEAPAEFSAVLETFLDRL